MDDNHDCGSTACADERRTLLACLRCAAIDARVAFTHLAHTCPVGEPLIEPPADPNRRDWWETLMREADRRTVDGQVQVRDPDTMEWRTMDEMIDICLADTVPG